MYPVRVRKRQPLKFLVTEHSNDSVHEGVSEKNIVLSLFRLKHNLVGINISQEAD